MTIVKKMEASYIFYKELSVFNKNTFSVDIITNNEVEIILKKDKQPLLSNMKINQKTMEKQSISKKTLIV